MAVSGIALGALATGGLFLYAGIKGYSVPQAAQAIIQGTSPANLPQTAGITPGNYATGYAPTGADPGGGTSGVQVVNSGSNQSILQRTAAQFGWGSGPEWQALQYVEMREAGYSTTAKNPTSGALGMAQALGHGTAGSAGSLGNEYGGYGLSDAQAKAANSGDATAQALWMCNYIRSRWGDPIAAAANERSLNWY